MLIAFNVKNFLSFRDRISFSMEKGERLRKYPDNVLKKEGRDLLKNALIFGANGSGKTNLTLALSCLKLLVIAPTDHIDQSLVYSPFLLDKDSREASTEFSIRFITQGQAYQYDLHYKGKQILSESLSLLTKSDKLKPYFHRLLNNPDQELLPEALKERRDQLRDNKLLLFEAQERNDQICGQVFSWFKNQLVLEEENRDLFRILLEDSEKKALFVKLLNLADINLVDIEVEETFVPVREEELSGRTFWLEEEMPTLKKRRKLDVYSLYKKFDKTGNFIGQQRLPFAMESEGTRKMMLLALTILHSMHKECVVVMDEFDDSFHLSLAKALLALINSPANHNQFIFTTHTLNLLDSELRKDQLYLMEKDFKGNTDLYSLFDFADDVSQSRSDLSFFKRYLNGLFGAVPDIEVEEIQALFSKE